MKTLITLWALITLAGANHAAELRVATVDLQRLFKEYYRAEEVAKQLEARHNAVFKELAQLRLEGERLLKEAHELQARSLDLALSDAGREETKKSLELKLADFRAFELSYDQTRAQRETEFQNQAALANKRILEEILATTRSISDSDGFNLVLNASKANPAGGDVLFARNLDDLTEKVLSLLNATKLAPDSSAAELKKQR